MVPINAPSTIVREGFVAVINLEAGNLSNRGKWERYPLTLGGIVPIHHLRGAG